MTKLIAIANAIAWRGLWAFGFLALRAYINDAMHQVTDLVLAVMAGWLGKLAYFWLVLHSEPTGCFKPSNLMQMRKEDRIQGKVIRNVLS